MSSISLEAFDENLRGRISQWILPSQDFCSLPNGFYDQLISGSAPFLTSILLLSKQDSKAWHLAYPWDMTFITETPTEWSLLLSILQHLKAPILIVCCPKLNVPQAFLHKCLTSQKSIPTCVLLKDGESSGQTILPHSIFFPKLDLITDTQFIKLASSLPQPIQQYIQTLDLRSIYRELRGSGASLCLSLTDTRFSVTSQIALTNNSISSYNATWFYPETNGALRLHVSDLRSILRTVTERLAE
jgi:hypothetical protein